jgi:hypothetical protein
MLYVQRNRNEASVNELRKRDVPPGCASTEVVRARRGRSDRPGTGWRGFLSPDPPMARVDSAVGTRKQVPF